MAYSNIIKGLNIPIGMDANSFFESLKELDRGFKSIKDEFYDLKKSLKLEWDNDKFIQAQELAAKSVEKANERVDLFNKALEKMKTDGIAKTSAEFKEVERELAKAETAAKKAAKEVQQIGTLKLDNLKNEVGEVEKKLSATEKQLSALKDSLKIEWNADKFKQSQELAKQAVSETQERAQALRTVLAEMDNLKIEKTSSEYRKLQAEITNAELASQKAQNELKNLDSIKFENMRKQVDEVDKSLGSTEKRLDSLKESLKLEWNSDKFKQSQELAQQAISVTEQKADSLKKLLAEMNAADVDKTSGEYQKLQAEITATETAAERAKQQLVEINNLQFNNMSKDIELTANKADLLRDKLDMKFDKNVIAELQKTAQTELDQTSAKLKAVIDGMQELERQGFDANSQEFKKLQNEALKLENDVKNAYVSLKEIEMMKFDRVASELQSAGDNLSGFGSKVTMGVTTPLLAAGAAAYKLTMDLNEGLANVASLNVAESRLKEIKEGVQNIAIEVGKGTDDIVAGAYNIISAYGDTADTMKMVEINAKAAKAGLATTNDAINLTSAVTKGYNDVSAEATQKAADLAFQTLVLGQTSFPDLASSIGKVVSPSNALKISQEELFAVYATLTGQTGNASEVSTQYGAVLTALMKPSDEMKTKLKELGYSSGFAAVEALGFKGTIDALINSVNGSEEELGKLINSKTATVAMFALAGAASEDYDRKLQSLQNSVGALDKAFEAQTQGVNAAGFSFEQSMIRMQVAAQNMGDTAAPLIEKAADAVEGLTTWLASLDDEQRKTVLTVGITLATFGPMVTIIGKITSGVGDLIQSFIALTVKTAAQSAVQTVQIATTEGATVAQINLNTAMSANPIGAVVAILGVLIAGLASYAIAANLAKEKTYDYNKELERLNKNYDDNIASIKKTADEQNAEVDVLEDLIKQYDELNEEVKNNQDDTETLSQKKAELYDIVEKLRKKLPDVVFEIERETGAYKNQTTALEELAEARRKALDADIQYEEAKAAKLALNKLNEDINIDDLKKQHADALEEYNKALEKKKSSGVFSSGFGDFADLEKKRKAFESLDEALRGYYNQAAKYENKYNAYVNGSKENIPENPNTSSDSDEEVDPITASTETYQKYVDKTIRDYNKSHADEAVIEAIGARSYATEEQIRQIDDVYKYQQSIIEKEKLDKLKAAKGNATAIYEIEKEAILRLDKLNQAYYEDDKQKALENANKTQQALQNLDNKKTSTKKEQTEEEKRIKEYNDRKKTLDLQYNAGEISSKEEYYKQLRNLRDEYLTENTDAWLQAEVELNKQGVELYNEKKQRLELEYNLLDDEKKDKQAHYEALSALQKEYLTEGSNEYLKAQKELNDLKKDIDKENLEAYKKAVSDMKFESEINIKVNDADAVEEYKNCADKIAEYREIFLSKGTKEYAESLLEEIALREKYVTEVQTSHDTELADLDKMLKDGLVSYEEYYQNIAAIKEKYTEKDIDDKEFLADLSGIDAHADKKVFEQRRTDIDVKSNDYDFTEDLSGRSTSVDRLEQKKADLEKLREEMKEYLDTDKEACKQLLTDIENATSELAQTRYEKIKEAFGTWDFTEDLTGEETLKARLEQYIADLTAYIEENKAYLEERTEEYKQVLTEMANATEQLNDINFGELEKKFDDNLITFKDFKDQYLSMVRELYGEESEEMKKANDKFKKLEEEKYKDSVDAYNKAKRELDWLRKEGLISEEEYFKDSLRLIKDYLTDGTEAFDSAKRNLYSDQRAYEQRIADEMEKAAEQDRKAREAAEKSERDRLEKERKEKVDALAAEKEAELKAAQDAQKRAAEAAAAAEKERADAEKTRLNAEKERLDEEKAILNQRIKNIDAEINKIRELSNARSEQESMDKLRKQLSVAEADYDYARLDANGDDYDRENKRLEVERLKEELAKAEQQAADNAVVKALEEEKNLIQEQIQVLEDQKRTIDTAISELKTELNTAASSITENIRQIAQEWAEEQIPPVTAEDIENAVIAALAASGYGTTANVSAGYSVPTYDNSSSVSAGRKMLEQVARSLGYTYETYMAMEGAKAEERRASETVNNLDIVVNANGLNEQQAKALVTEAVGDALKKEFG